MIAISALDIERWADRLEARSELPRLVRKLVLGSNGNIRRIEMPAGEGVQRPGWDGQVEFSGDDPWVPTGESVWEMGAGKEPAQKAGADYAKRTDAPGGVDPAMATFVFVTPRNWGRKDNWTRKRRAERRWHDVRAYDAQDLETWLERGHSAAVWLAEQLGIRVPGLRSVEVFWADFVHSTDPALSTEIVLAGRDQQVAQLGEWLAGDRSLIQVWSDSPSESAAFVAAALVALPMNKGEPWLARAVVAEAEDAWRAIARDVRPLNVLLPRGDLLAAGHLKAAGHRVIVPLGQNTRASESGINLPRLKRDALAEALQSIGLADPRAKALASESGRSLLVLQRRLGVAEALAAPAWSKADAGGGLVAGLIAGGWDEEVEGDREALTLLAGKPYEVVSENFSRWSHESDAPFRRAGSVWRLTAPSDSWLLLSRYVSRDQFERYREVTHNVLGTADPSFELPPEERWAASVHGKSRPHSTWLREGLAEGLVLLAMYGEQAGANSPGRPEDWVRETVATLLRDASGIRWASLQGILPLLAEASPEAVLDATEAGLEGDPPPLLFLFEEEGDPAFGRCNHSGLLWALENMAWNPAFLTRVGTILAALARLDPGGRWANRPAGSLKDIFLSWLRHTAADVDQRLAAIEYLVRRESEIGWQLMMDLLPNGHGASSGTHEPRWRDWAQDVDKSVTIGERNRYLLAIADCVFSHLNDSGRRRADLLDHLTSLPKEWGQTVIDSLDAFSRECTADGERVVLRSGLREFLHRHSGFPDADWSVQADVSNRLVTIYDRLEPTDPLTRFAWLFNDGWPRLPDGRERSYDESQEQVAAARRAAVREIFEAGGVELVIDLARLVSYPHVVGLHAAEVLTGDDVDSYVYRHGLGNDESRVSSFARAFVSNRGELSPPGGLEGMLARARAEKWQDAQLVDLCLGLPATLETWRQVAALGSNVDRGYWARASLWSVEESVDALLMAVGKLIEAERPSAAFSLVEFSEDAKALPFEALAGTLQNLLTSSDDEEEHQNPVA